MLELLRVGIAYDSIMSTETEEELDLLLGVRFAILERQEELNGTK